VRCFFVLLLVPPAGASIPIRDTLIKRAEKFLSPSPIGSDYTSDPCRSQIFENMRILSRAITVVAAAWRWRRGEDLLTTDPSGRITANEALRNITMTFTTDGCWMRNPESRIWRANQQWDAADHYPAHAKRNVFACVPFHPVFHSIAFQFRSRDRSLPRSRSTRLYPPVFQDSMSFIEHFLNAHVETIPR